MSSYYPNVALDHLFQLFNAATKRRNTRQIKLFGISRLAPQVTIRLFLECAAIGHEARAEHGEYVCNACQFFPTNRANPQAIAAAVYLG